MDSRDYSRGRGRGRWPTRTSDRSRGRGYSPRAPRDFYSNRRPGAEIRTPEFRSPPRGSRPSFEQNDDSRRYGEVGARRIRSPRRDYEDRFRELPRSHEGRERRLPENERMVRREPSLEPDVRQRMERMEEQDRRGRRPSPGRAPPPRRPGSGPPRSGRVKGAVFLCNDDSRAELEEKGLCGLARNYIGMVSRIKPGTPIFIFSFDEKLMFGVYETVTEGQLNLDPGAFGGAEGKGSRFPAQVKVKRVLKAPPLPERIFKRILEDNYFKPHRFELELNEEQVDNLTAAFDEELKKQRRRARFEGQEEAEGDEAPAEGDDAAADTKPIAEEFLSGIFASGRSSNRDVREADESRAREVSGGEGDGRADEARSLPRNASESEHLEAAPRPGSGAAQAPPEQAEAVSGFCIEAHENGIVRRQDQGEGAGGDEETKSSAPEAEERSRRNANVGTEDWPVAKGDDWDARGGQDHAARSEHTVEDEDQPLPHGPDLRNDGGETNEGNQGDPEREDEPPRRSRSRSGSPNGDRGAPRPQDSPARRPARGDDGELGGPGHSIDYDRAGSPQEQRPRADAWAGRKRPVPEDDPRDRYYEAAGGSPGYSDGHVQPRRGGSPERDSHRWDHGGEERDDRSAGGRGSREWDRPSRDSPGPAERPWKYARGEGHHLPPEELDSRRRDFRAPPSRRDSPDRHLERGLRQPYPDGRSPPRRPGLGGRWPQKFEPMRRGPPTRPPAPRGPEDDVLPPRSHQGRRTPPPQAHAPPTRAGDRAYREPRRYEEDTRWAPEPRRGRPPPEEPLGRAPRGDGRMHDSRDGPPPRAYSPPVRDGPPPPRTYSPPLRGGPPPPRAHSPPLRRDAYGDRERRPGRGGWHPRAEEVPHRRPEEPFRSPEKMRGDRDYRPRGGGAPRGGRHFPGGPRGRGPRFRDDRRPRSRSPEHNARYRSRSPQGSAPVDRDGRPRDSFGSWKEFGDSAAAGRRP
uniref:Kelch-like protein 5-like n=1 Tax=Tetraselmis sp. GSL018 TaxID=582737 RepID=A0A061RAC4_9CHLO